MKVREVANHICIVPIDYSWEKGGIKMKQRKGSLILVLMLFVFGVSLFSVSKVEAAVVWNESKPIIVEQDNVRFSAYLSEDEKCSWIYYIEPLMDSVPTVKIPEMISGVPVTKLGFSQQRYEEEQAKTPDEYKQRLQGYFIKDCFGQDSEGNWGGIREIIIPSTVNEIGYASFWGLISLETINIPDGIKRLEPYLFFHCLNLKNLYLPNGKIKVCPYALYFCGFPLKLFADKEVSCYSIDGMLLSESRKDLLWVRRNLKEVIVPSSVTCIGASAMYGSMVQRVAIPSSVTSIGNDAFSVDQKITFKISPQNKNYGVANGSIYSKKTKRLVAGYSNKGTLKIPKQVKILTGNVSIFGPKINKIIIPKTVKRLDKGWCTAKTATTVKIYFKSNTPPPAKRGILPSRFTLYISKSAFPAYKKWLKKCHVDEKRYTLKAVK